MSDQAHPARVVVGLRNITAKFLFITSSLSALLYGLKYGVATLGNPRVNCVYCRIKAPCLLPRMNLTRTLWAITNMNEGDLAEHF